MFFISITALNRGIDKPESKSQSKVQAPNPKREFGLWAVSIISWVTNQSSNYKFLGLSLLTMSLVSMFKSNYMK